MQAQDSSEALTLDRRAELTALGQVREFGIIELARAARVPTWRAGKALGRLAYDGRVERTARKTWRVVR